MAYYGVDDLFKVYLLGWYSDGFPIEDERKIYVKKHKNYEKALDLLPVRFQNCDVHEVAEKLYWDYVYVDEEENPDWTAFGKVLAEAERLFPGVIDVMKENWYMDVAEILRLKSYM